MLTIELLQIKPDLYLQVKRFFEEINTREYVGWFSPHPFNEIMARQISNCRGRDFYAGAFLNKEKMVGYGMLRGWDEGHEIPFLGLCILKDFQGIGLGRLMLNYLEVAAALRQARTVGLKVRKENDVALNLYKSARYFFEDYDEFFLAGTKTLGRMIDK